MIIRKILVCCLTVLPASISWAQTVEQKLTTAFSQFEKDPQLQFAISSLYVVDAATGKVMHDKNSRVGLAPASTQKIVTSITAFELLGKTHRYKTEFTYDASSKTLGIIGSGDPTLGSDRYANTKASAVLGRMLKNIPQEATISTVSLEYNRWTGVAIPDGWIWQDLGNYYGAVSGQLNWRENKFDLILRSGSKIGDPVAIVGSVPDVSQSVPLRSLVTTAARGSGDNAYIYLPSDFPAGFVRGTIPAGESRFVISGSLPSGDAQLAKEIIDTLSSLYQTDIIIAEIPGGKPVVFHTETSPPLDSIIYWFNRRSINLYGEALLQTMAFEKTGTASGDSGVAVLKDFWKQRGVNELELNMVDGSGLSPLNRLTTHAQVEILKYARNQPWFSSFMGSLPEYNGMKMKSGTISGVKGFSGYHTSKSGRQYVFSFLVNNYNGNARTLVNKMYKVLDVLK